MTVEEIQANSIIEEVILAQLQADDTYQRDTNETLVDDISNNWDEVASELILVSKRGKRSPESDVKGGLFVVNGQHRSKAAQKRGMTKIRARIIDLSKHPDPAKIEAGLRLKTNNRMGDRPLERFKAQVRAGVEESIDIVRILGKYGTYINASSLPDTGINCVATIESVYRQDEGRLLADTAKLIKDTYGEFQGRYSAAGLVKGASWFIEKHAEETNRERLIEKLQGIGLTNLLNRARTTRMTMSGSEWLNVYREMVALYNEKLQDKNKLHWKYKGAGKLNKAHAGGHVKK
jgi:hypothetical protein